MQSGESNFIGLPAQQNMQALSIGPCNDGEGGAAVAAASGALCRLIAGQSTQNTSNWSEVVHSAGGRRPHEPLQAEQRLYIGQYSSYINEQLRVGGTVPQPPQFLLSSASGLRHHSASFLNTKYSTVVCGQELEDSSFGIGISAHATHSAPHDRCKQYSEFNLIRAPPDIREDQEMARCYNTPQISSPPRASLSPTWRADETAAFMTICSNMPDFSATTLWEEVARKFHEMGYQRSAQQCKDKYENLPRISTKGTTYGDRRELVELSAKGGRGPAAAINYTLLQDIHEGRKGDADEQQQQQAAHAGQYNIVQTSFKKRRKAASKNNSSKIWAPSKGFFERITREIVEKQESLHRSFLEAIERKERERAMREEGYRRHEAARRDREQEMRAQQVSLAASRDAALIAFLNKLTTGQVSAMAAAANSAAAVMALEQPCCSEPPHDAVDIDPSNLINTRRWPKVEVHALIRLRSGMEPRFREAGPKAHLWQEISASMAGLGFMRSPRRCKEKWENINKYFKKAKESSKKRPENAKTCPYFHQLDALYQRGILTSSSFGNAAKLAPEGGGKSTSDSRVEYSTEEDNGGSISHQRDVINNGAESAIANIDTTIFTPADHQLISGSSPPPAAATSILPLISHQMENFLQLQYGQMSCHNSLHPHDHPAHAQLKMSSTDYNITSKKSTLQVEMFVKDIVQLQQQQHQKLLDEYDRMEQAHLEL